jgi:exodeoxyribonuclease VII small subunit
MPKPKNISPQDFETAIAELNQIVEQMEQGGLKIEDSLQHFERGINLVRNCQVALKTAEQKVQLLIEQGGETSLTPFDAGIDE